MGKVRHVLSFLVSLFLVAFHTLVGGFILKDVQFEGLRTVKLDELRDIYKGYLGKDINLAAIDDIVANIDYTGYFEDVRYELIDTSEDSKILKVKVRENTSVAKIELNIKGPGVIDSEAIKGAITLVENKAFSFVKFWESISNIEKLYSERGYIVATPRTGDRLTAFVYVTGVLDERVVKFNITEYVLYKVDYDLLSDDKEFVEEFEKLKSEFTIKQYKDYEAKNWFLRLFDSEKDYVPTRAALQSLLQQMSRYVYFRVIGIDTQEVQSTQPAKGIVINVLENRLTAGPVQLNGVRVKKNTIFSQPELIGETKAGTYTNLGLLKYVQMVKDKYERAGYFVDISLEADPAGFLDIIVTEYKVGQVKIVGNDTTAAHVFEDLIQVKPGDFLTRSALQSTYFELVKTNFFKAVDFGIEPSRVAPGSLDVAVKVVEKDKKFDFQGGVAYGPVKDRPWWDGIAGFVTLSTTNPFGNGENLSLNLQKSLANTNLNLAAGIRRPFGWPLVLSGTFKFESTESQDATSTTSLAYSLGVGTIKTPVGQLGIEVKVDNYTESSSQTTNNFQTLVLSANYTYETLDNLQVPMRGVSLTGHAYKYFPLNETGSDALSYLAEFTLHVPLLSNISLASRILAGQVFQTSGKPVTYALAGFNQVRGTSSAELSGTNIGLLNAELRYKERDVPFYASVFYDVGFVSNAFDFANPKSSYGVEFGLVVPVLGLVRFGWGVPLAEVFEPKFYWILGKTF